eukprot:jgi/Bigna1/87356/estExt_fgenesh1_pg.C_190145
MAHPHPNSGVPAVLVLAALFLLRVGAEGVSANASVNLVESNTSAAAAVADRNATVPQNGTAGAEDSSNSVNSLFKEIQKLREELNNIKIVGKKKAGTKSNVGENPTVCPPGEKIGMNETCESCPPGSYSNTFSQGCKTCPADTYQPLPGQARCKNCPQHSHTLPYHLGNKKIEDCQCHAGYSMNLDENSKMGGVCARNNKSAMIRHEGDEEDHGHLHDTPEVGEVGHHHHRHDEHKIRHLKPSEIGHQDPLFLPVTPFFGVWVVFTLAVQFVDRRFFVSIQVTLAAYQVGRHFLSARLPLISGYLIAGILSGPHLLGLLSHQTTKDLRIIDQFSISCIALAAGMELKSGKLKKFMRPIAWVLCGFMGATFISSFFVLLFFSSFIPFVTGMAVSGKVAVALLISTIMIARSPASAIAIVKDAQAEGPFSTMIIGVSIAAVVATAPSCFHHRLAMIRSHGLVVQDVLIIVVFALNLGIAEALIRGSGLTFYTFLRPVNKILWSGVFGATSGFLMDIFANTGVRLPDRGRDLLVLSTGLTIFFISSLVPSFFSFEPLLACVIGGIFVVNFGRNAAYHDHLMDRFLPYINILFFTSAGAELEIDHLLRPELLFLGLGIFSLRIASLWLGATLGGWLAGRPSRETSYAWMGYVTQAGVAMGLAKDVAREFPEWGQVFASMMIFQMAINQVVGPPLFKYAIVSMGECRAKQMVELEPTKQKQSPHAAKTDILSNGEP